MVYSKNGRSDDLIMSIKKVELHTHLEGTASPSLVQKIAKRNGISLRPGLFSDDNQYFIWKDFLDFLAAYEEASMVIRHPTDYYDITYEYLKQCALEETIYVEMMYSPEHAERASGIPQKEHLAAIQQAIDDAYDKHKIVGRILMTAVRHYGLEATIKVANEAAKRDFPCVVGFGMGGDEGGFPPGQFKRAYQIANEAGLGCTTHAGEMCGPEGIIEALDNLPVTRLGHGVRAIEDKSLLKRIKEDNIHLEICPCSNICLQVFDSLADHPFKQFFDYGISVSLNSDDPPYFQTTVGHEYQIAQTHLGISEPELQLVNKMAIEAAFIDENSKKILKDRL